MGRIWQRGKNGLDQQTEPDITLEPNQAAATTHQRRPPSTPYIPGSNPHAEQFIIIPKNNVALIRLLRSFGAETVTSVSKAGSVGDDHLVLTLPESLDISSGRFANDGEFRCTDQLDRPGIVPEIIKSSDGHIVAGLFSTFKGDTQVIGPTWSGIAKRLEDRHLLLPQDVIDVKVIDLMATEQDRRELEEMGIRIDPNLVFPEGSNWEKLMIGVTDLANYPIKHHCRSDLASSLGLTGSSKEATVALDALLESVGHHHSAISFGRGKRFQKHVALETAPIEPAAMLDR